MSVGPRLRCATRQDEAAVEQQRSGGGEERRLALPRPARALPSAATTSPARMSELPSGRRRIRSRRRRLRRACRVSSPRSRGCGRGREPDAPAPRGSSSRRRRRERHGDGDADREPDVHERQRPDPADACPLQRAGAEQRRCEKAAEEVVDAERRVAPVGGRSPRDRARAGGEGTERGGPGQEARCRALPVPATRSALRRSETRVAKKARSASISAERRGSSAQPSGAAKPPS